MKNMMPHPLLQTACRPPTDCTLFFRQQAPAINSGNDFHKTGK